MSQENVEVVRRGIAAGFAAELPTVETMYEFLAPDCVLTTDWGVEGTEHHGVEGFLAARGEMTAAWDSWRQDVERVLDAGDDAVVVFLRFRAMGRETAIPVEFPWALVVELRDGKIVTARTFLARGEALEAVGLEG
jgi:ketosteroid isomerase-like protein